MSFQQRIAVWWQQQRLLWALQKAVGKRYVLTDAESLRTYECDGCLLLKAMPAAVVLPKTTQQVAAVVKICQRYGKPFVARGAGTGLSGGALSVAQGGIIIGLNRMTAIVNISAEHRTATVQPGVVNAHLNQALAKSHPQLFYAPDPSSQSACTLGGNIAENAGGIHCIAYGVTGDHILALEVVLPNGEVVWTGGHSPECPGIDLTGIVVGSEGTLGIVTQAVVQLLEKPPGTRVYLASFATVNDAAQTVSSIIAQGLSPTALEFMDAFTVRAVNAAFQVGFPEASQAVLLIELSGPHVWLDGQHTALNSLLQEHQVLHVSVAKTDAENQKLWAARKGAVAAYGRLQPAFYVHDCVIPRHQLAPMLAKIEAISQEYQVPIGNVFHAGDGNLHPNILFDPSDADMVSRVVAAGDAILKACLAVGGTLTGEHGIGIEKSKYMRMQFSEADLQAMAFVKHAFDPGQLSNPHKIFPIHGGCGEARHQPEALKNLMAAYPVWI